MTAGSEGEPVRGRVPRRLLSADPDHERLIDLLVASRLVTSDAGVVEIAHEALARAWPRLRAWLDDDVEGQRILHHLTGAADAWDSMGRPDSELYRGVRLDPGAAVEGQQDTTLTATEIAFLEATERHEQSEQRAAEERARAQARLIRRLRGVLAGAVGCSWWPWSPAASPSTEGRAEDNAAAAAARADAGGGPARRRPRPGITDDIDDVHAAGRRRRPARRLPGDAEQPARCPGEHPS